MLSIGAMQSGQERYYHQLAAEDYYLEGGEPPGAWFGQGAEVLGLAGAVESDSLSRLFQGYAPVGGRKLVQNAGRENRQPGWDLTFSAPKSVSVLWSQCDEARQRAIQNAHAQAVARTLSFLERNFAYSRVGKGGDEQVKAGLVVATFEHSSSRALDPQLHTHSLVMNLGVDDEGSVRTIQSKPLYQAKMLAGAYYRMELSRTLQADLGIEVERPLNRDGEPQGWFEVQGIPSSILSHFSKRRAAIEAKLGSRGLESASAAAFAALTTREGKTVVPPRSELYQRWREEGRALGFSLEAVFGQRPTRRPEDKEKRLLAAISDAVSAITFSGNVFTKEDLVRFTLEEAVDSRISAEEVVEGVERALASNPFFVSLGTKNGARLWTTQEVLADEQEFLQAINTLTERKFTPVSEAVMQQVMSKKRGEGANTFQLSNEQAKAASYICQGAGSVKVVSGFAGTGKTEMLVAAREALEKQGYRVLGAALAGVAARQLQEKAGIKSATIRSYEYALYPGMKQVLGHHARQLWRAAQGKSTSHLPRITLDAKTVLVIDEAGMVGTRDFTLLAKAVVQRGGSIVAVGDERQLASIERGGCFGHLVKKLGGVRLEEIRRQNDPKDRNAVRSLSSGNPRQALEHYAEKGQLFVGQSRESLERELLREWREGGGTLTPEEHRIFVSTRTDVARMNQLCQWERVSAGVLDPTSRIEHGGQTFMVGDRVRFGIASRTSGIRKGEAGTVVACKDGFTGKYVVVARHIDTSSFTERTLQAMKHHARQLIAAALGKTTERFPPRHDVVLVPLASRNPLTKPYKGLVLDYAITTHLGQGQTVKNSYVLLGGGMTDRELSYVQGSRHSDSLHLYATEMDVGQSLADKSQAVRPAPPAEYEQEIPVYSALVRQMALSRAKELATSVKEQLHPEITNLR